MQLIKQKVLQVKDGRAEFNYIKFNVFKMKHNIAHDQCMRM